MNSLYKCWPETVQETSQCDEAIVVRINGNITDSKLVDRPREIRNLKLLNSRGIANKLLATFGNGIVYVYVKGENLERTLSDWKVIG